MRFPFLVVLLLLPLSAAAQIAVSDAGPISEVVYTSAPSPQTNPVAASNGTDYLVVWTDYRATGPNVNSDIFATRVAADGTILDPAGIALPATFVPDEAPDVIWNGDTYVVAIATSRFGFGINAVEIGADGKAGAMRQLVAGEVTQPSIAWNGSAYLVAWVETNTLTLKARLFDRGLHPIGDVLTFGEGVSPSVAAGGSGFLVSWHAHLAGRVRFATVTATGRIGRAPADLGTSEARPSVAFNGVDFAVAWPGTTVQVARITPDGSIVRVVGLNAATSALRLAWNGTRYVAIWIEADKKTIAGAELDASLEVIRPRAVVAERPNPLLNGMDVTTSASHSFIVFSDNAAVGSDVDVRGALVTRIDRAEPFLVSYGEPPQWPQDVAAMNGIYGSVWLEHNGILRMGRLDVAGRPLDGGGRVIAERVTEAKIAASGDTFAIVFLGGATKTQSWVVRVSREGIPLEQPFPLSEAFSLAAPVVAGNADGFTVAWSDEQVWSASLRRTGPLGEARLVVPRPADGRTVAPHALAWAGGEFVLMTEERRYIYCGSRLCNVDTKLDLHVLGDRLRTIPVSDSAGSVTVADFASDGTGLIAMWISGSGVYLRDYRSLDPTTSPSELTRSNALDAEIVWSAGRYYLITDERQVDDPYVRRIHATDLGADGATTSFESARSDHRESLAAAAVPRGGAIILHVRTIARTPEAHLEGSVRGFVRFLQRLRRRALR